METQFTLPEINWRSKLRALAVIALKDWRYFWRYPLNVLSIVLQPLVWLVPVFFMGQAFSENGQALGFAGYSGTTDFMSFILIGTALGSFVNTVFWGMGYALKNDMDAGVLESNWLAPLPRPLILVGRTLSSLLITAITTVATLLLAGALFGFRINANLGEAILIALPMLLGLYGFGFAFAALVLVLRDANTLVDTSNFIVQTFSGTDFPVTVLPRWLLPVSLTLPLTYGLDAVRFLLLGTQTLLPVRIEVVIIIVFMVVFIGLGLWVFRGLERRVRRLGTLGQY